VKVSEALITGYMNGVLEVVNVDTSGDLASRFFEVGVACPLGRSARQYAT